MTGLEPAASTLAWWRSDLFELHPRVRQPLFVLVAYSPECAGLGACLSDSFMSVRWVWVFRQPHVVVISVALVVVGVACVLAVIVVSSRLLFLRDGCRGRSLFRSSRCRRILAWLRGVAGWGFRRS